MANKVLIIEDHPGTYNMISDILKINGFDVAVAGASLVGLEKAKKEKPDLILLDIMMPEMGGLQVCKKLKSDPETSKIPVIFISIRVGDNDVKAGKEAGAIDYVKKPFDPDELVATIKKYIGG